MTELLIVILVVVIAARFTGELMERLGQLALLGELLIGILLGLLITYGPLPHLGGLVEDNAFKAISNLGMLFLMLMVGMEMDVNELIKASKTGIVVAIGGVIVPITLGFVVGIIFIPESQYKFAQSFLLAVTLAITAVPALSRVLMDLKLLNTKLGHTIMNAAIVDDILGLLLLAVLTIIMMEGSMPSGGELLLMVGKVLGFFVFALLIGRFLMPLIGRKFEQFEVREIEFSFILIIALALGIVAEYAGMHFIVGALVAGMFIREGTRLGR
jgi:Kef-type K+ transport system membrane component KefB